MFRSLSFRLALAYLALFALSVAALIGLYYWINIVRPMAETRYQVIREADRLHDVYVRDGQAALLAAADMRARALDVRKPFHAFISRDGSLLSANLPSWPRKPVAGGWTMIEADLYRDGDESDHDALAYDRVFSDGARLIVGRDVQDISERQETLAESVVWIVIFTILLGIIGAALMSRAIATRIEAINATARRVISGDLSGRVPVRGSGDDFDRLAETLNLMLARIDESVEAIRRVSDSVAHELRTPLARLQADLEDLDAARDDPDARSRLIGDAIGEAARLNGVFDALLRIARIEGGRHGAASGTVDLTALLLDAVEFYVPQAELSSMLLRTDIAEGLVLRGDKDMLFQAVSNLLDNAIKYSPAGGTIRISARADGRRCRIAVCDEGPGLTEEEFDRATERFYRGRQVVASPGIGLGLTLVAAVATLHKAELSFRNGAPGLCVELALPL
nr:HAMP domain-containing sensor histidine kinase [Sphingomonas colocasiae]